MICPKCGFDNKDHDLYCIQCGTKLEKRVEVKKKSKLPIIIVIIALIIAGAGGGYYFLNKGKSTKDYPALIAEADEFLQNENYEQAIAKYLDAIEVEPKEVKPYVQLADIYVIQEDYDSAINILNQAKETIGEDNEEINSKYDEVISKSPNGLSYPVYYDALTALIDEYGELSLDTCDCDESDYKHGEIDHYTYCKGVIFSKLVDIDGDGANEMLVYYNDGDSSWDTTLVIYGYDRANNQLITHEYKSNDEVSYLYGYNYDMEFMMGTKDGKYYLFATSENTQDNRMIINYFYTFNENKESVLEEEYIRDYTSGAAFYINGKAVSTLDEFNNSLNENWLDAVQMEPGIIMSYAQDDDSTYTKLSPEGSVEEVLNTLK